MSHICPPYCHMCPAPGGAFLMPMCGGTIHCPDDDWRSYCFCERPSEWRERICKNREGRRHVELYIGKLKAEGKDTACLEHCLADWPLDPLEPEAREYVEACARARRPLKGLRLVLHSGKPDG